MKKSGDNIGQKNDYKADSTEKIHPAGHRQQNGSQKNNRCKNHSEKSNRHKISIIRPKDHRQTTGRKTAAEEKESSKAWTQAQQIWHSRQNYAVPVYAGDAHGCRTGIFQVQG